MNAPQIYIIIAILALAVIAAFVIFMKKDKKAKKLTPLASLSFAFVIAGIIFGDDRLIGYSLMGIGIILAIIDAVKKSRI